MARTEEVPFERSGREGIVNRFLSSWLGAGWVSLFDLGKAERMLLDVVGERLYDLALGDVRRLLTRLSVNAEAEGRHEEARALRVAREHVERLYDREGSR